MASPHCAQCETPLDTPYIPKVNTEFYEPGDICSVLDTTSTPVYLLLTGNPPPSQSVPENLSWGTRSFARWSRSQRSMSDSVNSEGGQPKLNPRPALMFGRAKIVPEGQPEVVTLCLMATFHKTKSHTRLPRVLQHFCIPIAPHPQAIPGCTHVHTLPEWQAEGTWLIAMPYEVDTSKIKGRWTDLRQADDIGASFKIPTKERQRIASICQNRYTSWIDLCERDHGLAERSLEEYKASEVAPERF
ncbi:hypothetical protein OH77DRAFT_1059987 [Trametes cingulata]|nr:hypothetical protein OH77DRAFT_1059987 [Trametes cingulata]